MNNPSIDPIANDGTNKPPGSFAAKQTAVKSVLMSKSEIVLVWESALDKLVLISNVPLPSTFGERIASSSVQKIGKEISAFEFFQRVRPTQIEVRRAPAWLKEQLR